MYLMNIPPVIATHTEWRTCGPPGGYSLPLCLNDSDSDLSTRGTPISDKVQMIIQSLRSTQSSVDMEDDKERKVLSAQEDHAQVSKVAVGPLVVTKSNTKGPSVHQQVNSSSTIDNESHDSDSDDSVDRGIEKAILEYLKEKDGPKRKVETCSNTLQPSKIPRSCSPVPGISKLNSDSNIFLTSDEFPKSVKIEAPITPALFPIKKYIKHKTLINESSFTTQETLINPSRIIEFPLHQTNKPLSGLRLQSKNLEEDSDSSSDDGIEEAIQKYQMEKDQQSKKETLNLLALNEDSDSTSDDGIEEAIRRYQLEQLKEKSAVKSLLNKDKQKSLSKGPTKGYQGTTEDTKKNKLKKKKNKMKKEVLSVCMPSNMFLNVTKGKELHSFKVEDFKGQPAPPKANTTAELMCAEAILDISKTVMPGAFHQTLGLSSSSPVGSCAQSLPDNKLEDESDDSSIDSEDGIEQEIRRFLEQKAQMHKQTTGSPAPSEPDFKKEEDVKVKDAKKTGKLSLTKKRKQKNENLSLCTVSMLSHVKGTLSETFSDNRNESLFSQESPKSKLHKTEQSGDKSSSLDSDEDLDTAIKDLLKTKKKLKKKTKDLKQKPLKCTKKEELHGYAFLSKKPKPDCLPDHSSLKKAEHNEYDLNYSKLTKHNFPLKKFNTNKGNNIKKTESESSKITNPATSTHKPETVFQIKEEDSSVDSDDSIELEIRKFLAEKAKVATAEQNKEIFVLSNGILPNCSETKAEDVEQENQLAEIPRKNIPLPGQSTDDKLPEKKLPLLSPQCLTLRNSIAPAGVQSHSPSTPACSTNLLEPADGAGAAGSELKTLRTDSGNSQGTSLSKGGQSVLSPNITPSQSASIKWRQSLGLPITDTKIRTPFHVTSSKINDTTSVTRPYQSGTNFKVQNPDSAWSSAKMSTATFSRSTEAVVNTGFRPHALSFLSSARQHPVVPFTQRLAPGQSSQYPVEEETKSMVHISKDKSVYVELETNRTNHVQVRSRDRSEEKESQDLLIANSRERKSGKMDDEDICIELKEESFIDEADYEAGNESNPEKKQGLSTLSLSSAIDPGFTFKPCIALSTVERSERFSMRCMDNKFRKGMASRRSVPLLHKTVEHVKRKLQFVPVHRQNAAKIGENCFLPRI